MHIIIGLTEPREVPEEGEMKEMALPCRHHRVESGQRVCTGDLDREMGANNMNINYDVNGLLIDSSVEGHIRSSRLGCLSWPRRREEWGRGGMVVYA